MSSQICPWCQMEIVWDAELGPEQECPHCFNELKDYRTLTIGLEDTDTAELEAYENAIEQYMMLQREEVECESCGVQMVAAGEQRVEPLQFTPAERPQGYPPLLEAPFRVQVYICPSCFQLKHLLSEQDRASLMHALSQIGAG